MENLILTAMMLGGLCCLFALSGMVYHFFQMIHEYKRDQRMRVVRSARF